ncbi:carboxymuconolactone decarboxylase family protein [Taibaiella soli]|uniref:Carboxymuconolactone decarboxylase family protein n=1 Tax=Taibaiella soli TaxID=1649169 RepID=A0A2W2AH83_9BACT|nr:carboxymuconolactone decarboxylase family protein [Taibaiella soli]PZF72902.1 carboxymuconolactone decarboxylase family protein [Taibaiella soli]
MQKRINIYNVLPEAYKPMLALSKLVHDSSLDKKLLELIKIRASQINGCAYCLNMHTRDARKIGETEQRIFLLNAWRETTLFTDQERAVLAFTEAVTSISNHHVPDDVYAEMEKHFTEQEIGYVLTAIVVINGWNRFAIATNLPPEL